MDRNVHADIRRQLSKRSKPETGQHAEPPAAELPSIDSAVAAEELLYVEDVQAIGAVGQSCHAHVAGNIGENEDDRQRAPARPEASFDDVLLMETVAPSLSQAHDSPEGAGEEPGNCETRAQGLRVRQQLPAEDANCLEGPDAYSQATADTFPALAPDASAGRVAGPVPSVHDDGLDAIATGEHGDGAERTGRQCDIRSQVLHMMDAKLPIALAMREAVEHFKCSESAPSTMPTWPHTSRIGRYRAAHRYRWLRVGRTWKKHAV